MVSPMVSPLNRNALVLGALLLTSGCGAVATSPSWVGGGVAVTGPIRIAEQEARWAEEQVELESQPETIRARHILVMHSDSQAKPEGVTRTREEARARASECLVKLAAGADFGAMVNEYSDEPGAKPRVGDLGSFTRGTMVKAFSDAAFALEIGELSSIVETAYGFHIIKRTR